LRAVFFEVGEDCLQDVRDGRGHLGLTKFIGEECQARQRVTLSLVASLHFGVNASQSFKFGEYFLTVGSGITGTATASCSSGSHGARTAASSSHRRWGHGRCLSDLGRRSHSLRRSSVLHVLRHSIVCGRRSASSEILRGLGSRRSKSGTHRSHSRSGRLSNGLFWSFDWPVNWLSLCRLRRLHLLLLLLLCLGRWEVALSLRRWHFHGAGRTLRRLGHLLMHGRLSNRLSKVGWWHPGNHWARAGRSGASSLSRCGHLRSRHRSLHRRLLGLATTRWRILKSLLSRLVVSKVSDRLSGCGKGGCSRWRSLLLNWLLLLESSLLSLRRWLLLVCRLWHSRLRLSRCMLAYSSVSVLGTCRGRSLLLLRSSTKSVCGSLVTLTSLGLKLNNLERWVRLWDGSLEDKEVVVVDPVFQLCDFVVVVVGHVQVVDREEGSRL